MQWHTLSARHDIRMTSPLFGRDRLAADRQFLNGRRVCIENRHASRITMKGYSMDIQRIYQLGQTIKQIYKDEVGGDPEDLIRIWDDGAWYYVVRNDDTQATVPVRDLAEDRRDRIAEALRRFQPIS